MIIMNAPTSSLTAVRGTTATPATAGACCLAFGAIPLFFKRDHRYFALHAITAADRANQGFICTVIGMQQIEHTQTGIAVMVVEWHRIIFVMAETMRFDYTTERQTTMTRVADDLRRHFRQHRAVPVRMGNVVFRA